MPKGKTATRMKRWWELVMLLKGHPDGMSFDDIYDAGLYRELDKKTFDRDIEDMNYDFGVVISKDQTKRYTLVKEGTFFFSQMFTAQEAETLALGLKIIAHFLPHMDSSALKVWSKLQPYIPVEAVRNVKSLAQITYMLDETPDINAKTFSTLTEAIRDKLNVNILYKELDRQPKRFTVSPKSICFKDGVWFLKTIAATTGKISLYRISWIRSATPEEGNNNKEDKS